jgi:Domain of unknown function (DUF4476)
MKKTLLIFSLFALSLSSFAQMSAVVYSEAGENFTLYLSGIAINSKPASNVKADNLTSEFYQARVVFENKSLPDVTSSNFACHKGMEVTYIVKKNKKGEYVLRYYTENPYGSGATATQNSSNSDVKNFAVADDLPVQTNSNSVSTTNTNSNQGIQMNMTVPTDGNVTTTTSTTTVKTTATDPKNGNVGINMNVNGNGTGAGINMNVSGTGVGNTTNTTSTTTNTNTNPNNANVGMNINVDGMNMGLNLNVNDPMFQQSGTTTATTTTTTSSHSSNTSSNYNTNTTQGQTEPAHSKPVNNGPCAQSMDASSFAKAKATVESKGFDDTKLTQAKQITKANCMTSEQIKEIMGVFGFEETRLAYAKYAYDYCFDKNNYYIINDAFSFESTIEELNQFLETK